MTDLISRADAIDAVRLESAKRGLLGRGDILDILSALPSAEAVSREAYHNLLMASDDIDRALREYQTKDETPSAEAIQGEWIKTVDGNGWNEWYVFKCPFCGATIEDKQYRSWEYNFCPNCGARMKGGTE
jgi:rubrerythrin